MPRYSPKREFKTLAEEIKSSGQSKKLTVRELLSYFYQARRSKQVTPWIRRNLSSLGLECYPDFESVYIDATVEIRKLPTLKSQKQHSATGLIPTNDLDSVTRDPVPRITLLPAANRIPVSVNRDADLNRAVTLMLMHDFSQLPVMQNERDVDGMISWRSIITTQIFSTKPSTVRDCLIREVSIVSYDTPLFNAVKTILDQEVVLVRGVDKKIVGLVTVTDIGEQFIALAEPFLILEQIENHIRAWLDGCFTVEQLKATLDPSDTKREVEVISDLTFGEYVRLLEKPEHWQTLNLSLDRSTFTNRLDEVRRIRNDVMHFDPDGISESDLDTLRETSQFFYAIAQFKK